MQRTFKVGGCVGQGSMLSYDPALLGSLFPLLTVQVDDTPALRKTCYVRLGWLGGGVV